MFGKLSLAAIPLDQPIPLVTGAVVLVVILAVLAWVVIAGHLPYLWREWITSVDHKRMVYPFKARSPHGRLPQRSRSDFEPAQ